MNQRIRYRIVGVVAGIITLASAVSLHADWKYIPTNFGNGADAEVRESAPDSNRGTSVELASRVIDTTPTATSDRNSMMYTRFDLTGLGAPPPGWSAAFRMTYRNNNLNGSRIQDVVTPDPSVRVGLNIYGLNPNASGVNWGENTITYNNAPGVTPDGDIGTRDLNSDLIYLGEVKFPNIGNQNWLPVGGELIFRSAALDSFVADALANSLTEITLVSLVSHDGVLGNPPFASWLNFNYLFNPKDMTTLNNDPNYDYDTTDPDNPLGSPWSGADNSTGQFSPWLVIVPEPSTVTLAGLAAAAFLVSRRRK